MPLHAVVSPLSESIWRAPPRAEAPHLRTPLELLHRRSLALVVIEQLLSVGGGTVGEIDSAGSLELLFTIERRLARLIRPGDVVVHPVPCCFVVLVDGKKNLAVDTLPERVAAGLAAPFSIGDLMLRLVAEIVGVTAEVSAPPEQLLSIARASVGETLHPELTGDRPDATSGVELSRLSVPRAATTATRAATVVAWPETRSSERAELHDTWPVIDWTGVGERRTANAGGAENDHGDPTRGGSEDGGGTRRSIAATTRDTLQPAAKRSQDRATSPSPAYASSSLLHRTAELTRREWEVLDAISKGLPTGAIAAELFVSTATVRSHVKSILRKLGAHSRLEVAALANRYDLGVVAQSHAG